MTNTEMLLLLFGLEFGLAAAVLGGFLWWRRRRARTADGPEEIEDEGHPPPSLYLERELALTRARVEELGDAAPESLRLRLAWLGLEREIAEKHGSPPDEAYWEGLRGRIDDILQVLMAAAPAPEPAPAPDGVAETDIDEAIASDIIEQQARTIDYLRGYIAELMERAGGDSAGAEEVEARFAEIERVNRELKTCVEVLEDENQFLRDQIAELLKLD